MRALQFQYFFSYGIIGSIAPLLTVFLKDDKGLSPPQVGMALAMVSSSTLITPLLITLLADTKLQTRRILAVAYALTGTALWLLLGSPNLGITFILMAAYGLSSVAIFPVQDGLYFSTARQQEQHGNTALPYPKVRLWGTVGYLAPTVLLWWFLQGATDVRPAVYTALGFALASVLGALFGLPPVKPPPREKGARKVPTFEALRLMTRRDLRWLCTGLGLTAAAGVTYHSFFPIYLRDHLHLPRHLIPVIINFGVACEILVTLLMPRLLKLVGEKGIIMIGLGWSIVRMATLALLPHPATAVLVQLGHGLEILALYVMVPILLNRHAGDHFRNSMQGAFSMFMGGSRLIGALIAGQAVNYNMFYALGGAAALALIAWIIVWFGFTPSTDNPPAQSVP